MLKHSVKPLIVCVTETHVTKYIHSNEINIEGYDHEICYTDCVHTGGVILYLKKELSFRLIKKTTVEKKLCTLVITLQINTVNYVLIGLYHSLNSSHANFLNVIEELIDEFSDKQLLLIGDFNIDMPQNTFYANKLQQMLSQNRLSQLIKEPTQITNKSAKIIDLVITNYEHITYQVNHTPRISDHANILVNLASKQKQWQEVEIKNL